MRCRKLSLAGLFLFFVVVVMAAPAQTTSLRMLYLKADLVVVGKIAKTPKWIPVKPAEDDNRKALSFHKVIPVEIEETLRGTAPNELLVTDEKIPWPSIGGPAEADDENENKDKDKDKDKDEDEDEGEDEDFEEGHYGELSEIKYRRLFFLKKDKETGLYLDNSLDRSFLMSQEDLKGYVSRLRELQSIYARPEPSMDALVEWLVSMAEDPNTRYDACAELGDSFRLIRQQERDEKEKKAKSAQDTKTVDDANKAKQTDESREPPPVTDNDDDDPKLDAADVPIDGRPLEVPANKSTQFAASLTDGQKERLLMKFLAQTFNYKENEDAINPAEQYETVLEPQEETLLDLVAQFYDLRLTGHLLNQLPMAIKYHRRLGTKLMDIIADDLRDNELQALAQKYSSAVGETDDSIVEVAPAAPDKDKKDGHTAPPAAPSTYRQLRAELLRLFLARSSSLFYEKAFEK